jgi:hypothetical protein
MSQPELSMMSTSVCAGAHAHRGLVAQAFGIEQGTGRCHQVLASLQTRGGDQVGVARDHQLVERGGLLHIGQHKVGAQAVAGQRDGVVYGV